MSFKTIKLKRGFTEIAEIFELAKKHNSIICGGYARYCASPLSTVRVKPAGDVDIFPKTEGSTKTLLADLRKMGFKIQHQNHVSITMEPKVSFKDKLRIFPTPQIIKPVIEGKIVTLGTAEEILSNFDFTIVRAAIISPDTVLVDKEFEEDELHGTLRLKNIHCPISSLIRCCKYVRKGYYLMPSEALKLFADWSMRDEKYRKEITALFSKSSMGEKTADNPNGITRKEIDDLEALLRID